MENMYWDILLFAFIAGILLFRLRSVLGERADDDLPPLTLDKGDKHAPAVTDGAPDETPQAPRLDQPHADFIMTERWAQQLPDYRIVNSATVHNRLGQFMAIDPLFRPDLFLENAKKAFTAVINAFAKDDRATIQFLLTPAMATGFLAQLDVRQAKHETYHSEILSLKGIIASAELTGTQAFVGVDFTAEQRITHKDAEGRIMNGLVGDKHRSMDRWIFMRDLKSDDPKWLLTEIIDLPD